MFRKSALLKLALLCVLTFATSSTASAQFGYSHSSYAYHHHYSRPAYRASTGYRVVPVYYRIPIYIVPAKPACGCDAAPAHARPASPFAQPPSLYAPPAKGPRLAPVR
ncbi:hypothetical protein [Fuerstiella marisgermanici]|uniref:Uncharacterized protein n=1 Tax=Fuerstiella marisgermanici TaxID=1891926 RepID=A0A1P8WGB3_9PLAN|nr:hypothetical protein [Fuerstiella marisgermanici]APZ93083.1 hypothetical protein Fuma_02699 [Fuerstiella marisgermanici]